METIEKNKYYEVEFDSAKNRGYLKFIGFWENADLVPNLYDECKKMFNSLKPGFTVITDMSSFQNPPASVGAVFVKIQEDVVVRNFSKIAEVINSAFVKLKVDDVSDTTGLKKMQFDSRDKAIRWLDE